jgi:hypothetical protein
MTYVKHVLQRVVIVIAVAKSLILYTKRIVKYINLRRDIVK